MSSGSSADVKFDIDLHRLVCKIDKMLCILHKECPDMGNAYVVSLVLVSFFEVHFGAYLNPESPVDLRRFVASHCHAVSADGDVVGQV